MQIHKTLKDARLAAKATPDIRCIVEIEHATEGRCYIMAKTPMRNLALALNRKPMPEIRRLIAEHSVCTESELAAEREQSRREHTKCERCGRKIDGNTAYSQQERYMASNVTAWYCDECHQLLSQIGIGEVTELQERATARPSREPYTKEDF